MFVQCTIALTHVVDLACGMPVLLTPRDVLWLTVVVVPLIGLSLLASPPDPLGTLHRQYVVVPRC